MHLVVWEFELQPGSERSFETMYGPDGPWVGLFRRDPGWAGTELLRDTQNPKRYLTIDRWRSAQAYDSFLTAAGPEYQEIDRAGEGFTVIERLVGRFEIDPLPGVGWPS
jgi:heme-degrading monooxygenase HmoA